MQATVGLRTAVVLCESCQAAAGTIGRVVTAVPTPLKRGGDDGGA